MGHFLLYHYLPGLKGSVSIHCFLFGNFISMAEQDDICAIILGLLLLCDRANGTKRMMRPIIIVLFGLVWMLIAHAKQIWLMLLLGIRWIMQQISLMRSPNRIQLANFLIIHIFIHLIAIMCKLITVVAEVVLVIFTVLRGQVFADKAFRLLLCVQEVFDLDSTLDYVGENHLFW